jgi:hypothetical protein
MTTVDPKATVKIRFTKDAEEVFALEDGRRKTLKISRGTIRMVRPASARYWVKSMGVAEQVRDGSSPAIAPSRNLFVDTPEGTPLGDLLTIREGLKKQDIVPVYEAFKHLDIDAVTSLNGLTGDSAMVLQAAFDEVAKTGSIDSVAVGDLTDAVNEAIEAIGKQPAEQQGGGVPALPGMPATGSRRGPGRPKASK